MLCTLAGVWEKCPLSKLSSCLLRAVQSSALPNTAQPLKSHSPLLCFGSTSVYLNDILPGCFAEDWIVLSMWVVEFGGNIPCFFYSEPLNHASLRCRNAKWWFSLPSTSMRLNLKVAKIIYDSSWLQLALKETKYFTDVKHWKLAWKWWIPGSWHCRVFVRMIVWSSLRILISGFTNFHVFSKMDWFYTIPGGL